MNHLFYLFCKSYLGDLQRVKNLWSSIQIHNKDNIPFYISVPQKDRSIFELEIKDSNGILNWISDEEIVALNPGGGMNNYTSWDGRLSQQVIKSEFWRVIEAKGLGDCSYLCMDSESIFIKDFHISDFMFSPESPFTVFHQNKELLQLANNKNIFKVAENFLLESLKHKKLFLRNGPDYDFGPTPVIWSSKVWKSLDENYLKPNKKTIWDAIQEIPSELRWYGESLLKYKSIELHPLEPIFKVYHYNWQYFHHKKSGETIDKLKLNYLGVLFQSNWNYQMDFGAQAKKKNFFSRLNRSLKQFLSRFR
jgi:hypothetical protein